MDVTLTEYARMNGKNPANVYKKYRKGDFKTARKVGPVILIDSDEKYIDRRYSSGLWVGYRENRAKAMERKTTEGEPEPAGDFSPKVLET